MRAGEVIAEHGVDAVGLRSLARDLGVTHAALTHHFGERQALLQELAREGFEALAIALEQAAAAHPTDEQQRLRAIGAAYLDVARRLPGHFRVMFGREITSGCDATPEGLRAASERAFEALLRPLGAARLDARALLAWAAVHGLASLWSQRSLAERVGSPEALGAMIEESLGLLAAGLVPGTTRKKTR
jgi:AcrR family transcriptional regulator